MMPEPPQGAGEMEIPPCLCVSVARPLVVRGGGGGVLRAQGQGTVARDREFEIVRLQTE